MINAILFWIILWVLVGMITVFFKMFVFFKGPVHMIEMYLSHSLTQKSMIVLLKHAAAKKIEDPVSYIATVQFVFGSLFAPLAIIELISDIIVFYNYTPPKNKD